MDLREHTATQQRHPWEVARFRFLLAQLRTRTPLHLLQRVLDAGAGDAWFSNHLMEFLPNTATITCWDLEYTSETMTSFSEHLPKSIRLTRDRPQQPHDLVLLLDVLEHVAEDRAFLSQLVAESLRPGGWLLFTVPAWQRLFSRHDVWLHHHRRYAPAQAIAVLQASGLDVLASGGLFHSLLLPRLAALALETLRPAATDPTPAIAWPHGALLTQGVQAALALDNAVSDRAARLGVPLPGLSFWALCRRAA